MTLPLGRDLTRRSVAFLIDIALLFAALAPTGWLVGRLAHVRAETGREIWLASVLNFSVPVWLYFILLDGSPRRGTLGKRLLHLGVVDEPDGGPVPLPRNALRTLFKLAPWEIAHVSAFALSESMDDLTATQVAGLVLGNVLAGAYLAVALATRGRRSVHDFAAGTAVVRTSA